MSRLLRIAAPACAAAWLAGSCGGKGDGGGSAPAGLDSGSEDGPAGAPGGSTDSSGDSTGRDTGAGGGACTPIAPHDAGVLMAPEPLSPFIVVDQLGYRTSAEKIAVIRSPQAGYDAAMSFTPGPSYALVDARSGSRVKEGAPAAWNGGATDTSSGDKAWWFDFSSATTPGDYYVLDETKNVRSDTFRIADDVYRDVMAQAMRMFFYQRAGFAKTAQYAGAGWADGAAFMGPLQDPHCREYDKPGDATTERDLHGGWFDAGDYNRYTNWGASDVIELLRAYRESPSAFGDDYGIPESCNGVPDVLDEAKWELDWLVRMQQDDGSLLTVVGEQGGSPPSSVSKQSLYGTPSTSSAFSGAAVFALGSIVYRSADAARFGTYADDLASRAKSAWAWAIAHPGVKFYNNYGPSGTSGLGAGDQEVVDPTDSNLAADYTHNLLMKELMAALYLFELTGDTSYRDNYFDPSYGEATLIKGYYAGPGGTDMEALDTLLEYTKVVGATPSVVQTIESRYKNAAEGSGNLAEITGNTDPYGAYLPGYWWGSNATKANEGMILYDLVTFGVDPAVDADAARGAERYVHYVHGVNPLGIVYLSNMGDHGAARSVTRFFHTWFSHDSPLWSAVGASTYGPPPGYLTGGPNPAYTWDACCPSTCGAGNACGSAPPSPPSGQPAQKSYLDFNDPWPLDSWQITEPDVGYQAAYVRLLAKFVR